MRDFSTDRLDDIAFAGRRVLERPGMVTATTTREGP
jgi:hypothetical protein